eukprot:8020077-Ditylum_brightwellii.AAC.1
MLHPETITIIKHFHQYFIMLQSFILRKEQQVKCFSTNNDFIPRSYGIKISLNPNNDLNDITGFIEL